MADDLNLIDLGHGRGEAFLRLQQRIDKVFGQLTILAGRVAGGFFALAQQFVGQLHQQRPVEHLALQRHRGQPFGIAAQQDVGAAAGHVGGDGHRATTPGLGHDERFRLVNLGVQHGVVDVLAVQIARDRLRVLNRGRADEERPACGVDGLDLVEDGLILGADRAVDLVGKINPFVIDRLIRLRIDVDGGLGALHLLAARLQPHLTGVDDVLDVGR